MRHARSLLEERGVSFSVTGTGDFTRNAGGGLKRTSGWLGLVDLEISVDTEQAGLWPGGELYLHGVNVSGHEFPSGELVGDLQGVNGNEAPRITRLTEAWYQQSLLNGTVACLAGVHDMNTEFAVSESGGLYLHSAFGLTPAIANNVDAPTYPYPGLGARVAWRPNERFSAMCAAYDGDPSDCEEYPHRPDCSWTGDGGTFWIVETAWAYELGDGAMGWTGALKTGAWYHTADLDDAAAVDAAGNPVRHDGNYGGYGIVDQELWREAEDQGLHAFCMVAGAPDDRNTVAVHAAGGLNYTGLLPARDLDQTGIAVTYASLSGPLRERDGLEAGELTVEATHRFHVNDVVAVQPDLQYVVDPGADPALDNAVVLAVRVEMSL